MTEIIYVARGFHGPPDTAHGGYFAGLMSQYLSGPVEVTIRRAPPLERSLLLERRDEGVAVFDGQMLVAEATETDLDTDIPPIVTFEEAEQASKSYLGFEASIFPGCLVCGPEPGEDEGLRLFTGPVPNRDLVAAPWIPKAWVADEAGLVRPEFIWAALDCPGAWALHGRTAGAPLILGRLAAKLTRPIAARQSYVVMAWPMGRDGRKGFAGSAVVSAAGELCALARATWIEIETQAPP